MSTPTIPFTATPVAAPLAVKPEAATLVCEFNTRQGIWHLIGGPASFYSVSLDQALVHARDLYGDTPVLVNTTDDRLNELLARLENPDSGTERRAVRKELLAYIGDNEIPLGSDDLHDLLEEDDAILDGWEPVVIAASTCPGPKDRVVAAVVDGDDLLVVLDGERPATTELVAQGGLVLRRASENWNPTEWTIDSVEPLTDDERHRLEQRTSAPLAVENLTIRGHRRRSF